MTKGLLAAIGVGLACATFAKDETLVFYCNESFPPFSFADDNGEAAGFDVDLLNEMAKEVGLTIRIEPKEMKASVEALASGEVDGIAGLLKNSVGESYGDYTVPIVSFAYSFYVRGDSPYTSTQDLRSKSIVTERGDLSNLTLQQMGYFGVNYMVSDQIQALQLVSAGNYDAAFISSQTAVYAIKKLGIKNVRSVGSPTMQAEYAIAMKRGSTGTVEKLNQAFERLVDSGRYRDIYDRWFSKLDEDRVSRRANEVIGVILVPLGILLAVVLFWSASLKRQVALRTAELNAELEGRVNAQKALQESQRSMRTLLSNLPGVAYRRAHDAAWTLSFVSDGCLHLFGYSSAEMLEQGSLAEFVVPEDRRRIEDQIAKAITNRRPYQFVYRIVDSKGKERWLWEQGRPIFDDNGFVEALEGFATDISDLYATEVALRHEQELLTSIVSHIPAVVYWRDRNLKLQGCNEAYAHAVGLAGPSEVLGKLDDELPGSPGSLESDKDLDISVLQTGQPILDKEQAIRHADGRIHRMLVSKVPLCDDSGEVTGIVSVHSDVTTLKETEEAARIQLGRVLNLRKLESDIGQAESPNDVARLMVDGLLRFNGVDAVLVCLKPADSAVFCCSSGFVFPANAEATGKYMKLIDQATSLSRIFCHQDLPLESNADVRDFFPAMERIRAVASLPVESGDDAIGGFLICSRTQLDLDAHYIGLLEMLAKSVGQRIDSRQRAL